MKQIAINPVMETTPMAHLTENIIYLMGLSFVLGSLFTIFTLLLLDFMRRDQVNR